MSQVETSQAAFESIQETAPAMREKIKQMILNEGWHGLTCDEVEARTGYKHQTASARLRELELDHTLMKSIRTRLTRSGRRAFVYVVRPAGCMPI